MKTGNVVNCQMNNVVNCQTQQYPDKAISAEVVLVVENFQLKQKEENGC